MASADIETPENKELHADHNSSLSTSPEAEEDHIEKPIDHPEVPLWRITISLLLLFINYFLAQYDKFILSYFQDDVISSLHLSQASYGILSGYATGIVYALLALPTAFIADYTGARVWVLSVAATWWSLCALFQGLSHNFWQILLARIGMGIGQAPVEALSVSLISDLMGKRYVFFGERSALPNLNLLLYSQNAQYLPAFYMSVSTSAKQYRAKSPPPLQPATRPGTPP